MTGAPRDGLLRSDGVEPAVLPVIELDRAPFTLGLCRS
jgi:hypothetical protein